MPAQFRAFVFAPSPGQPSMCCSGAERSNTARAGDLVVLPADNAARICESMPGALTEIKGRKLSAMIKRAGVSTVADLAALPHSALQSAKPTSSKSKA